MSLEAWSDALGFLSGAVLLVTAFRNDGLSAFVDSLRSKIEAAKAKTQGSEPDQWAGAVVQSLEADLTRWTAVDRWSLRVGAALLCLSYALKVLPSLWRALMG